MSNLILKIREYIDAEIRYASDDIEQKLKKIR